MTITTEEAEALAKQADDLGYPLYADSLRALAAERDAAIKIAKATGDLALEYRARVEAAEAEADRTSNRPTIEHKPTNEKCPDR